MSKLIYAPICSVDGFIEDSNGRFDWGMPDEEVHQFVNDLIRPAGTHLYGRKMYETMSAWETEPSLGESSPVAADFAQVWQSAEKVVFSSTLQSPVTRNTRIERTFEPDAIRELKARSQKPLLIGGAQLAAVAFKAGLVDECHLILAPISVGRGKPSLPTEFHVRLELRGERRFTNGMVHLHYSVLQK